jgi:excisionase family DNA binding protein
MVTPPKHGAAILTAKLAYSVSEVGQALGVSRPTIYRLINAGELRAIKIVGRTVVTADDLDAFLASREVAS